MTFSPLASGAISGKPFAASTCGSDGRALVLPCPYCGDRGVPVATPPLRRCPVARSPRINTYRKPGGRGLLWLTRLRLTSHATCKSLGEHTNPTEELALSLFLGVLLDEEGFPKLVSAHEGLHRAESDEQVLNLAVLVNLLRRTQYRRRNNLEGV